METIFLFILLQCVVRPEQSTDVGDLIQPAPGVLYEDYRLKKGDPRRYQVNTLFIFSFIFFYFCLLDGHYKIYEFL